MKHRAEVIGIDPLVDFAFKLLLGSPEHARVTVHFLNAILGSQIQITGVTFQNPIQGKNYEKDKLAILDIVAVDLEGRKFNIEVQTTVPAGLRQRLAYYDARLYVDQSTSGAQYRDLKPAIVICVLSKSLFPQHARLHSDFRLRDESGQILTDDLQVHLLELTKLKVKRDNLATASSLERWSFFLLNATLMTPGEIRKILPDPEFVEATEILEMIKQTPEQLHEYSARMKLRLDDAARLEYAREEGEEKGLRKGLRRGRQEGREEGLQEGRQEGREEGRQEGQVLGQIKLLQEMLGLKEPTAEELAGYELSRLTTLLQRLRKKLRSRPQ